jgi:hypothetical protein
MNKLTKLLLVIILLSSFITFSAQKSSKKVTKTKSSKVGSLIVKKKVVNLKNFLQFQLPQDWESKLDGTEFVFYPKDQKKKKLIFGVIAAKLAGKVELSGRQKGEYFLKKLKKPWVKKIETKKRGKTKTTYKTSIIRKPGVRRLTLKAEKSNKKNKKSEKWWVVCTHANSEMNGYETKYAGTIRGKKDPIAMLVALTYKTDQKIKFKNEINLFFDTLKVTMPEDKI